MDDVVKTVLNTLDTLSMPYDLLSHEPAARIEECRAIMNALGAIVPRNLFLTTRRQGGLWLCLMRPDAPFRSGEISRQIGSSRLCFADERPLYEHLCVRPGSVSPLGLMFDRAGAVTLLMDRALSQEERLIFHPCLNSYSVSVRTGDFLNKFLPFVNHVPLWIDVTE